MTQPETQLTQNNTSPKRKSTWPDFDHVRFLIVALATAIGIYLCYLLAVPFLSSLTWALVLSVTSSHAHDKIEMRIKYPNLAAVISVSAILVLVVLPLVFVLQQLISETANGAVYVEAEMRSGEWRKVLVGHPSLTRAVVWIEQQLDLAGTAGSIASLLTTLGTSVLRNSISQLLDAVLTFYLLFFFFA